MIIRYKALYLQCLVTLFLLSSFVSACRAEDGPPPYPVNPALIPKAHPHFEPRSRYGNPTYYRVKGHRYHVARSAKGYDRLGIASWYGRKFHGNLTSTREHFNMYAMTAASRTLPLPTYVRVTNLENGRHVIVRVNDRGPFSTDKRRIIDLSYAAALKLGYAKKGTARVRVTALNFSRHARPQKY